MNLSNGATLKPNSNFLNFAEAVFSPVFPLDQFFLANQRFVGARANKFWQYGKHSFTKLNKFGEI